MLLCLVPCKQLRVALDVDDLVLISQSPVELQAMIDTCQTWCEKSRIEISAGKTTGRRAVGRHVARAHFIYILFKFYLHFIYILRAVPSQHFSSPRGVALLPGGGQLWPRATPGIVTLFFALGSQRRS